MEQPRTVRINIDVEALRRALPSPEPRPLAERLREAGSAAAPAIQKALDVIGRLRR